ncbi:DUF695 domain-containing protein [Nocardioides sp. GXZ039]|uniref:DUF695 domain-containing protein n=1 Tax=Nocardioides sp. GXZ039 TaxID=3136018 RepID=UPI0030F4694D
MALFGKRQPDPTGDPKPFWQWWTSEGAAACEAAIEARSFEGLSDELTDRVHAIHNELVWELGSGVESEHQLIVTAEGDPEARAFARRWLRAAPPRSEVWEYGDSRRPDPGVDGIVLQLDDTEIDFGSVRVAGERVGNHVDVRVHHPAMPTLTEQLRNTVMFLALDSALGESDCETWIGSVEAVVETPPEGEEWGTLGDLRALVEEVRDDSLNEDGDPVWVLLRGDAGGTPVMAAAQVPLAGSWAPDLDLHLAVSVPYRDATDQGLPKPETLDSLRALEDHLSARLGTSGRLVAHETTGGVRTLHYYADSTTPARGVVEGAVTGWGQGDVEVSAQPDPGWHAVRHLRT